MLLLVAIVLFVGITITVTALRMPRLERRNLLREAALLGCGFAVYFLVRKVTEGSEQQAHENAELIIRLQEWLGIFIEPTLNQAAASRDWLTTSANWVYIWGHWPAIALVAAWLYYAHRHGYRLFRNAFLVSGAIGFLFFAFFPAAPPRFMGEPFVDTISEFSHSYRVLQPPEVTNQYAAMPSLHFGWNLLIGIAVARYATRTPVRIIGALSPLAMLTATVLTANHYLLDLVVGAAVALTGLAIAALWLHQHEEPTPPEQPGMPLPVGYMPSTSQPASGRDDRYPAPAAELGLPLADTGGGPRAREAQITREPQ